jgi:Rrf2 family nitric oxide-sensitive transcriptional repressor
MKLTGFTDYSLRVLIYLAADPGRRATVAEIATAFDVKVNHLTKVVHFLGQQGWLANVRGKGGGMGLALPPELIVIGQVVRATEGADLPAECFGDTPDHCQIARICRLRGVLREAVEAFHAVLDGYTLADLVLNQAALVRVLHIAPGRASPFSPHATAP